MDIYGERQYIFIWTLINSPNQLYNQIVKYSLYNCTTIIGANVRYFMNKYDIYINIFIIKLIYIAPNIHY